MWSRRKFVFSTLAGLALWADGQISAASFFDNKAKHAAHTGKMARLSGEYWPPAVACDFIGILPADLCCIVDEFGRLVIANILPPTLHSHNFPVLGKMDNLGGKVFDLQIMSPLAVVVAWNQINSKQGSTQDGQFVLNLINLARPKSPRPVSKTVLPNFSEFHALAVSQSLICVAGVDGAGANGLWLYKLKKGQLQKLVSLPLAAPVKNMFLGSDELLVAYDDTDNQASLVDLSDLSHPKIIRTVKLGVEDSQITVSANTFAFSSMEASGCVVKVGNIADFPKASSTAHISALQSVEAIAMNGNNLLVFGNSAEKSAVITFALDKNLKLFQQGIVHLNRHIEEEDMSGKLVLGRNNAFIGFGWEGVQILSRTAGNIWTATASYSVPKLPVASQVVRSNYLVLAGSELRLYDLKKPSQPALVSVTKLATTVKEMVLAGSYNLCLNKENLSLRKIENESALIAEMPVTAKKLCFDASTKKAYLIQETNKKDKNKKPTTKLLEVNVYADRLETGKTFAVISEAYCASAADGYVLVGNIGRLTIYKPDQDKELLCDHRFKDLAWRDIILSDGKIYATAVDPDANAFFYAMSFDGTEITVLGFTKIPHDGVALAVKENRALTVGQSSDGSNLLVVLDLNDMSAPKVIGVQSVLDSACSVACTGNLAIVSGRGFEIFRL